MRPDLTTDSGSSRPAGSSRASILLSAWHSRRFGGLPFIDIAKLIGVLALGALLLTLFYQIPATHDVDIGGYDAAYVQGFYDSERDGSPDLVGSNGTARWTHDVSYLLFPQAGLPAQVTLRLRGRANVSPPDVVVLLNGTHELGRLRPGAAWEEHTFSIDGGLLKPSDVVIEIRSTVAPLSADDPRPVGVLLDRAIYRTGGWPITPYPAQLAYGALAVGMLYILTRRPTTDDRRPTMARRLSSVFYPLLSSIFIVGTVALGIAFLALYRLQPPYPYPLRWLLPAADLVLAVLLALRHGPALAKRVPALLDGLALGTIGVWTVALLLAARDHVTLSTPGVENDFGVFARRSAQLVGVFQPSGEYSSAVDGVFRADGFYNLGYPLLLWLARPLTQGNPFLAAQLISALSGALLLGAAWWLARRLLGRGPALLALLILALSPLVVEYGLYIGTDMLFAALCTLALALLTADHRPLTTDHRPPQAATEGPPYRFAVRGSRFSHGVILAGLAAGAAFLVRHPGLLLLPLGWLALWRSYQLQTTSIELADEHTQLKTPNSKLRTRSMLLFTLVFLIASAPQLIVNIRDTGQPLYSQQAKNVWLCVYGSCDWGRWDEAPNNVTLGEIVLRDPGRFLVNWWANVRGFFGAGAEDTSEFGHAIQLRLLGFPANWLALGGLLAWLVALFRKPHKTQNLEGDREALWANLYPLTPSPAHPFTRSPLHPLTLLLWIALYVLTVSVGIALPRFFLPLAPIYAIAAAWVITRLEPQNRRTAEPQNREPRTENREPDNTQYPIRNTQSVATILLLLLLWGGFAHGAGYVLRNQPADEVAAVRLVQSTLRPGERLIVRVPPRLTIGQYSVIAHLVAPDRGQYLLALGGDAPTGSTVVGAAGQFTLYRLAP
jgi:Dolichyl-phosphate-mannose-protein mannosyltransferase